MKIVLFDLGNTLEEQSSGTLLPGARETLESVRGMVDANGEPAVLALVSDFGDIPATPAEIAASRETYYGIIEVLGIREFFEPVSQRITLSTEVGVEKPKKRIFLEVIRKVNPVLGFGDVLFTTERKSHVTAARRLGMKALHFKGPGERTGDIVRLIDLLPLVRRFVAAT